MELRQCALDCLAIQSPVEKVKAVSALQKEYANQKISLSTESDITLNQLIPGLPNKPELVSPREVKHRAMNTDEGRAAMIHALAHIEFNAINLGLDAIWRFADMPEEYYGDWLKVAAEEAYHFSLLDAHLNKMGYEYGDFNAHASLWEMAEKTKDDVLARMALVPRTMEARGLDASPALRNKLAQIGDEEAAAILDIILRDEIGHVAIGNHWFNYLCTQRQLEPISTYANLAKQYQAPTPRKPFNHPARLAAGFTEAELDWLENPFG